jgi:hypothetical protein
MMFRRGSFFIRVLAFFVIAGILIGGAALIYQAGQAQGYALGLAAGNSEGLAEGIQAYPYYLPYLRPHFGFTPFGPLLGLLAFGALTLLFFALIGAMFRPHAWRTGQYPGGWHGGYAGPHPWGPPPAAKEQTPEEANREAGASKEEAG